MRRPSGADEFYDEDQTGALKRISSFKFPFFHFLFSISVRSEPAATEEKAGAERGEKDRPAIAAWLLRSNPQCFMQGRATSGRAEIAGNLGDWRKSAGRNTALLREQSYEAGIWLVRRKRADGTARNTAAQLHGGNNFFQACDRCARKSFAVELHVEAAILRIADLDGSSILACTAKEEFTQAVALDRIVGSDGSENKGAGAVTEKASKFTCDSARS